MLCDEALLGKWQNESFLFLLTAEMGDGSPRKCPSYGLIPGVYFAKYHGFGASTADGVIV
jgi:hypothetical protein